VMLTEQEGTATIVFKGERAGVRQRGNRFQANVSCDGRPTLPLWLRSARTGVAARL
jgi:hypothetical protein